MDHWTENYREEENNLPVTVTAQSTLFCTVASLQDPAMIVYDVATKFLETEIFPQGNIAGLISGITFIIYCLVQSGEAFMVKGKNTYTHRERERER